MSIRSFTSAVGRPLRRRSLATLQINVGKLCNQACTHCHVEAGPKRPEQMDARTADRVVELLRRDSDLIGTVDITGGAPELNPHFRRFVSVARELGKEVIDRCNLTVLLVEGQEDTAQWLADHQVRIIASLPCYGRDNVDAQRGRGVFDGSIQALQRLNALGYGTPGTGLVLDLVYNPGGAFLPPDQRSLEADYKGRLQEDFGIVFDRLLTLTNMPISRFRSVLERQGKLGAYMQLLAGAHNPATVDGVMCLDLVSVGWDGRLYDCDFNQMLDLPAGGAPRTLWEIEGLSELLGGRIALKNHCYGCTAGAGSSCGGALAK